MPTGLIIAILLLIVCGGFGHRRMPSGRRRGPYRGHFPHRGHFGPFMGGPFGPIGPFGGMRGGGGGSSRGGGAGRER